MRRCIQVLAFAGLVLAGAMATGTEPGWSGKAILFGEERAQVKSLHILDRPYRPLHFYGNTVRRRYYHGTTVPSAAVRRR